MKELFSLSSATKVAKCFRDHGEVKITIYRKVRKGYAPVVVRTEFVDAPLHVEPCLVMEALRLQAHLMLEGSC